MAVYTLLDRKTLERLAEHYGLGKLLKAAGVPAGSVNTHYLLETRKGKFYLKIDEVKSPAAVQQELELLLFLRAESFPCPHPLAGRHGEYLTRHKGKNVSLYAALPGQALPEDVLTPTHLEAIGHALASLHVLGQGYKKPVENRFSFERITELYQDMKEKMPAYFRHLIHTLDDEVAYQQQYREDKLPKGIIHGDLFADNVLFRGSKLVGVLDFEAACQGKFIYDLATAVNALVYTRGRYDIARFTALLQGYQSVRNLSLAEWDAFPSELRFSALRFTVTRLKDFFFRPMADTVRVNKDFREFLERLQVLRRERPGGMNKLLMAMATGYDYRKYQKPATLGKPDVKVPFAGHTRQHAVAK
ncbi:MAG: homoserine kinase [Thermodesulfobacteriota bacterium]